jgi:LysR family transcriptional regulator for bpeEF and oprC
LRGHPEHPRDLTAHQCINHFSRRTAKLFDWVFAKDGQRTQTALRGMIALDDENSYVAAAEAGLGVAQIPAFVVKEAMERAKLELVLADWLPEPSALNVVYPQHRRLSSKVRVFVQWIAELFHEHDGIQLRSRLRVG